MGNVAVLAGKEFRGFLRSPLGYALLAMYALVSGLILVTLLFMFHEQLLRLSQQAHLRGPDAGGLSAQLAVVGPYLLNTATLLLFVTPFLTMRSFAEEKRQRSLEILISYPLRMAEIVAGKYLGVFLFLLLLLAISVLHLVIIALVCGVAATPLLGGVVGLLLFGAALIAIGLFVSALAGGQVEAAVLTLGVFLVLAMLGGIIRPGGSWLQAVLANLSPLYQYQSFGLGLLVPGRLLYFLAVTLLFVGLAIRGVDLIKWRG